MVGFLWICDTIHQVLVLQGTYSRLVVGFGDSALLAEINPDLIWQALLKGFVAFITQSFFLYRIWKLNNGKWLVPVLLMPAVMFQLVGEIVYIVLSLRQVSTAGGLVVLSNLVFAINGTATAVDILISALLVYYLLQSRTGFTKSNQIIARLIVFTAATGMWTAVVALIGLITLKAYPTTLIYAALDFVQCPLYCITLLSNLNAREFLRGQTRASNQLNSFPLSIVRSASASDTMGQVISPSEMVVHVDRSQYSDYDILKEQIRQNKRGAAASELDL